MIRCLFITLLLSSFISFSQATLEVDKTVQTSIDENKIMIEQLKRASVLLKESLEFFSSLENNLDPQEIAVLMKQIKNKKLELDKQIKKIIQKTENKRKILSPIHA